MSPSKSLTYRTTTSTCPCPPGEDLRWLSPSPAQDLTGGGHAGRWEPGRGLHHLHKRLNGKIRVSAGEPRLFPILLGATPPGFRTGPAGNADLSDSRGSSRSRPCSYHLFLRDFHLGSSRFVKERLFQARLCRSSMMNDRPERGTDGTHRLFTVCPPEDGQRTQQSLPRFDDDP